MRNPFHLFRKILFLLIAAILIAGCAKQSIVPHGASTQNFLFPVSNAVSENQIVNGAAQIDLVTPESFYPVKAALIIKKPSYLRLELLPLMGPPDFFLSATPQELKILLPEKGEFYQGKPSGRNLSRFLPWQFNIGDIIAILTCTYPPLTGDVSYLYYPEGNALRIEMKTQRGIEQKIWRSPDGRLNKLERFHESGKLLYSAEFTDYAEGSPIAGKININIIDGTYSIAVKYSDLKIEKAKDLSIFDLPMPPSFRKIIMD